MKYAVEMIYIPNFVKIDSGSQKQIGGIQRQTAWRSHKPAIGI
jgi:hypothetical protein